MKTDRLIGILSVLLQKEKVTAPELAEMFEVSRRTINRDIDDLLYAGIPVRTSQGAGGGISIAEGYKIDRTILTSKDMQMILAGLRSLDSVSGSNYYAQLMEKICAGSSEFVSGRDSILIDLSSWYKTSLSAKIPLIQDAIEDRHILEFDYYAPSGESKRSIEPYYIVFKWTSWYVYGWCLKRKDYRLFKLNRMDKLRLTGKAFTGRDVPAPDMGPGLAKGRDIILKALFEPDMKWRLVEEFGPSCYEEIEDGRLLLVRDYKDIDNLTMWMLTFGDKAEVLEPREVRERLKTMAEAMSKIYGGKKNGKDRKI